MRTEDWYIDIFIAKIVDGNACRCANYAGNCGLYCVVGATIER